MSSPLERKPWERNGRIIEDAAGRPIECDVCPCPPPSLIVPRCVLCTNLSLILKLAASGFANETNCTNCPDLNADWFLSYLGVQNCLDGDYDVWQSDLFSIGGCAAPGNLADRRWLFGMRNIDDTPGWCFSYIKLTGDGATICNGTRDYRTGATWGKMIGAPWACFDPITYDYMNCTDYWTDDCNFGFDSSHSLTIGVP